MQSWDNSQQSVLPCFALASPPTPHHERIHQRWQQCTFDNLTMNETELTQADKNRIKDEIKLTLIIGLLFTIALIVVVFIIPIVLILFKKPADGFIQRGLIIIGMLALPMLVISWTNIVKYVDLKKGKKISLRTTDYEIKKEKEGFVLRTRTPMKLKFDLYDKLPDLIKLTEPITVELTKLSKTLLFISQDNENLLEKVEREND